MKFHINESGEVKQCKAQSLAKCPVKNVNGEKSEHYDNRKNAEKNSEILLMKKFGETKKISKLVFIPKILKNSYIGIPVDNVLMKKFENTLKNSEIKNIDEYMENRNVRDLGHYHCTIISPREFRQLKKAGIKIEKELEKLKNIKIDFIGIGSVEDKENDKQAWFVIANSEIVDNWRKNLNLEKHYLHVTLAFKNADVHNVEKDEKTLINI